MLTGLPGGLETIGVIRKLIVIICEYYVTYLKPQYETTCYAPISSGPILVWIFRARHQNIKPSLLVFFILLNCYGFGFEPT